MNQVLPLPNRKLQNEFSQNFLAQLQITIGQHLMQDFCEFQENAAIYMFGSKGKICDLVLSSSFFDIFYLFKSPDNYWSYEFQKCTYYCLKTFYLEPIFCWLGHLEKSFYYPTSHGRAGGYYTSCTLIYDCI